MPIVSSVLTPGDPTIQADGQRRGTVTFTFTNGKVRTKSLRAPDAASWAALLLNIDDEVQAQQELADAEDGVNPDDEILANGEASIEQRAVAYLRDAYSQESPRDAYLLMDRFNDFRNARGWNLNQVQAGLASAGLGAEEWDNIKTAYQYLNNAGRPATMNDWQAILAVWEGREQ